MSDEPIRISWSMLRAHEECQQKSFLLRSGKRAKAQNIRNYFHGMVVDNAMRQFLDDPWRSRGDMIASVDRLMEKTEDEARDKGDGIVRWKDAADKAEVREFCLELVTKLEPILEELVIPYTFTCGYRFSSLVRFNQDTIKLNGEMDLLVANDGWRVWDLKGTRDDQYYRKVFGQLVFYDLAVSCLYDGAKTVEVGLIQPMCKEPVMRFRITDDDRRQMWARILRMAADIKFERNRCKESTDGCQWCEVKHACPRFTDLVGPATSSLATALRAAKETL